MQALSLSELIWFAVGFSGQASLSLRILARSLAGQADWFGTVPRIFWYFSIAGGATLLVYAIHRADPVFIVGQGAALLYYIFNLVAIEQRRRRSESINRDSPSF